MRVIYWARLQLARAEISDALGAVPGAELAVVETLDELLSALPGAAGLVLYDAPPEVARQVVEALRGSTVRWMHFLTAGREGFEAVGVPRDVQVTDPAGAVAPTVVEHAMALLLALARQVPRMLEEQRARNWDRLAVSKKAVTLEGGVIVIVGYGRIGREVARLARAFGMRTIGLSRTRKPDAHLDEAATLSELQQVVGRADAVVVSAALTEETRHLIGPAVLAACKPGALLVNVARGGLVDQSALAEALRSGRIGGAGLDAVDPEPLPADDPLWDAPNLIVSPHFAGGASAASRARLADGAAENLRRLIAGEPLENVTA